jgi:hypothetical protein
MRHSVGIMRGAYIKGSTVGAVHPAITFDKSGRSDGRKCGSEKHELKEH